MKRVQFDLFFWLPIVLLLLLGFTILKSTAPQAVLQQAIIALIGLAIAFFVSRTSYQSWTNFAWPLYFLSLALLLVTLLIGQSTRGSIRWIPMGPFKLQASEVVKPLLTLFFAQMATLLKPTNFKNILWLSLLLLFPALLIFRQPDLGSSIVVVVLWLSIIFAAGLPLKYIVIVFTVFIIAISLGFNSLKAYQQARLTTFIDPTSDPLQSGYNLLQSIIAVGSGRFLGRGLGHGTQSQLRFLPESHTDFVFASLAEELGFLGSSILLSLFALLFFKILKTAHHAADHTGRLLTVGIFAQLMFQVFINIGMNIGLVPITGITLPLISAGGSSLLSTLFSLGLTASVLRFQKQKPIFEIH